MWLYLTIRHCNKRRSWSLMTVIIIRGNSMKSKIDLGEESSWIVPSKLRLFLHRKHEKYAKREGKANLEMEEVLKFYANKTSWHFAHHKLFSTHWIAESWILTFSQLFIHCELCCLFSWRFQNIKGRSSFCSDGKINANKAHKKVNKTFAMQTAKLFGIPCHSKQLFHFRFCVRPLSFESTNFCLLKIQKLKVERAKGSLRFCSFCFDFWWNDSCWCSFSVKQTVVNWWHLLKGKTDFHFSFFRFEQVLSEV